MPFLQDHVIYDKVVVSGAALAVMMADGARALTGSDGCVLSDLRFPAALVIPSGAARKAQLQLVRDGDGFEATVLTLESADVHATARVDAGEAPGAAPSEPVRGEAISTELLDSWLRARSVVMDRPSGVCRTSWSGTATRVAICGTTPTTPAGCCTRGAGFGAATGGRRRAPEGSKAFVPTRIARLALHGQTGAGMRCHASAERGRPACSTPARCCSK